MMVEDKPKKKQRKWWRRISIFVALILLCWAVLFAVLKWWFPERLVIQYAVNYIQDKYNVTVTIEDASIDPFARIEFSRLAITYEGDNDPIFYVTSIKFSYDIWSLLIRRQLKIHHIALDSPLIGFRTMTNGQWNFMAILEQFESQTEITPHDASKDSDREFPIQIQLKKFEMKDIRLSLVGSLNNKNIFVVLGPIDFLLNDVTGKSIDNLSGKVRVNSADCQLLTSIFKPQQLVFESFIDCDIVVDVTPDIIDFSLNSSIHPNQLSLNKLDWQPKILPDLSLSASLSWNRNQNTISCTSFNIASDPFQLDIQAEAALDSIPKWSLSIAPTSFNIALMIGRAIELNLPGLEILEQIPDIDGSIELKNFNITGSGIDPKSQDFQTALSGAVSIEIPTIALNDPVSLQAKQLVSTIEFGGGISGSEITSVFVNIVGGITEVHSDSLFMSIGVDSIAWDSQLTLDESEKKIQIRAAGSIGDILDGSCEMAMQAILDIPHLLKRKTEAINQFDLRCAVNDINLDPVGQEKWGGTVTAELQITADDITSPKGNGTLILHSPWVLITEEKLAFPDIEQAVNFRSQIDIESEYINLIPIHWTWSEMAQADILVETTYPNFRIEIDDAALDMSELYALLPRSLLPQIELEFPAGIAELTGVVEGSVDDIPDLRFEVIAGIDSVALAMLEPEVFIENVCAGLQLTGGMQSVNGKVQLSIGSGGMPGLFPDLLDSVSAILFLQYKSPDEIHIDSLSFQVPAFVVSGNGNASFDINQMPPKGTIDFEIHMDNLAGITIWDTINYKGSTAFNGSLNLRQDQILFNGEICYSDVDVEIGSLASVTGLTGCIPITQLYSLSSGKIISTPPPQIAHRAMGFSSYPSLQTSYQRNMEDFGIIGIDSLQVMDYGISDLTTDVMLTSGYLEMPAIQCRAYGGNVRGNLWVTIKDMNPDSLQCGMRMNAAGIQTGQIVATSKHDPEESIVCAVADLVVSGFPGTSVFDIQGTADVTRIGRGVALDLLQIMDPEGQDEGIQSTRRFLLQGWGVKVFSFRIQDGFVYSSMVPTAPPPSKLHMFFLSKIVRLPPQITYGRIPLKFLLQMQGIG